MSLAASAGRGPGAMWSPTHVQVTVLQARGLRAKGPGGTSDAYAVIQVGKEKYATSVSERSLGAPVWREEATFELPPLLSAGAVPAAAATLQLTVLHRALLGLDKFLGRAEVDLRELHRDQGRRKTQWYTLKSKPGKKDKERGQIEVDIQFMRNNMTASMFDLSMKDKSRNPFGKLKDKIKGKNKDSASDTASAIIPSMTPSVDSDDESFSKDKKKKSKIKTLFSKSNLQKTPLSQSMSVLPTSKADRVLLRPGDFQSQWEDDDNEDESSSASDIMSHRRTASADPKQLNQTNFTVPKKEGLSFLGGLRSKNDSLSRSNVCINGNHVYVEQPEAKDSSPSNSPSPQGFRKKHLFSSTENLAARSWKESGEGSGLSSDRRLSETAAKDSSKSVDSLKSLSLPSYRPLASRDMKEHTAPPSAEAVKETKDSKKQESKKPSLLSLVTGKKDVAKGSESESSPSVLGKEKEGILGEAQPRDEDLVRRSERDAVPIATGWGNSLNPFEDVQISEQEAGPESKSEPKPPVLSARAPQTKAVKPRLEVSPEAQAQTRLPSSPYSILLLSAFPSSSAQVPVPSESGCGVETQSPEEPSVSSSFSSPIAAPISTSTPIEHWPSIGQGQASSEESPLLLNKDLQKENLTPAPNTGSSALGSLCKQSPIPAWEGTEDSPRIKTSEPGTGQEGSSDESGVSLLKQPGVGLLEEPLRVPSPEPECTPTPQQDQEALTSLPLHGGGIATPVEKLPMKGHADSGDQSRSSVESKVSHGALTSAIKEVAPVLCTREGAPQLDTTTQKGEEMGLNATGGQKKVKKRVSFSEQLFVEEEVEQPAVVEAGGEKQPQELTLEGAPCTEDAERGPETVEEQQQLIPSGAESLPEGPPWEVSAVTGTAPSRMEGDNGPAAQCQSKASDDGGSLCDPLHGLPSVSDVKPPIVADLNLSLPSIPEVASDDEKVDEVEDSGTSARLAALEVDALSLGMSPLCPEKGPSGGAHVPVPTESLRDFRPGAPEAAPLEQVTVLGIHKLCLGKSTSVDKELPGSGAGEEEKSKGSGRPSPGPSTPPGAPGPSPSLSEDYPAEFSSPGSTLSNLHHTSTATSHKKASTESSVSKVENFGKRKPLLQAWVAPSETHPVSAPPGTGTGAAKHRLHPVKPMNTTATKTANSSLGTATITSENMINEAMIKKYSPSDPAFAYSQLTHDELIQLVLKQKETISKKEFQVRELEDYIDNLLVRVMEETPNILRVPSQVGKKAGKM